MKECNLIRYANCWEDTNNILKTLEKDKKVLSICSGGDNTLAILLNNPKKVIAFDTNINQIYLLKLKMSAFKNLTYNEVLILLGISQEDSYNVFLKLKDKLDEETYNYFQKNKSYFKKGIINIGKFEHYFQIFKKYICPLFATEKEIYKLANMTNLEEQKQYYNKKINNFRLRFIFKIFFGFKVMGKYGRDKSFYNYVPDKEKSALEIKNRFDNGIETIINSSNPYLNYILLNKFSDNCLPEYLKKENFEIIKKNIDKISIVNGTLLDINDKFDYFNLSDIFEYMSYEEYQKNIKHLNKIASKNAIIIYYNMQNKRYIEDDNFIFLKDLSQKYYKETRSYFYRDFLVYEKRNKDE